ncbi:hypothetical protein F4814DRAFT_441751 [Daldinia grandis]|nr:hypothetical protein F4814DRAFT_441751 [Daldinia grandis]
MDWLPDSDLFIGPNNFDLFDYDYNVDKEGQKCQAIQNWGLNATKDAAIISLHDYEDWETWAQSLGFVRNDEDYVTHFTIDDLPQNGFSILCVPRAKDVQLTDKSQPSAYTDLPLKENSWRSWRKIVGAFHLPGHFPKVVARQQTSVTSISRTHRFPKGPSRVWMHTAVANPDFNENSFAIAATHFDKKNITLAAMFSCSEEQILRIRGLVDTWKDAIGHPLLMLGIYAELQLDRLGAMVNTRYGAYEVLMELVKKEVEKKGGDRFGWEMIDTVRSNREDSKKVEEEIKTTRLQLSKACSSALEILKTRTEDRLAEMAETTNLFSERFNDIITRLDGLGAKCQIIVEGISFTTDIIRSELSREEAQTSVENSKFATGISLMAMIYLPLTTMATIFAMPIFQWSNDWRDWRYQPVDSENSSSANPGPGGSGGAARQPVVSGYIWLYVSISIGLSFITFLGFRFYIKLRSRDKKKSPPTSIFDILSLELIR